MRARTRARERGSYTIWRLTHNLEWVLRGVVKTMECFYQCNAQQIHCFHSPPRNLKRIATRLAAISLLHDYQFRHQIYASIMNDGDTTNLFTGHFSYGQIIWMHEHVQRNNIHSDYECSSWWWVSGTIGSFNFHIMISKNKFCFYIVKNKNEEWL